MRTYTRSDIEEADRLYDDHSQREVSRRTGIPKGTIARWAANGWITTESNHNTPYSEETIQEVGSLAKDLNLGEISDLKGIPVRTLHGWRQKGWIQPADHDHPNATPQKNRERARRAYALTERHGYQKQEVAEKMGVAPSTISLYLKMYRQGNYIQNHLD